MRIEAPDDTLMIGYVFVVAVVVVIKCVKIVNGIMTILPLTSQLVTTVIYKAVLP